MAAILNIKRLFSYVVDHDYGFSPNLYHGACTLAHCKYGRKRDASAGHGKLIYAMRVDEILTLAEYFSNARFENKKERQSGTYEQMQGDNLYKYKDRDDRHVLISRHFYYFGKNAITIPNRFREHPIHPLEKKGPGYRSKFNPRFVEAFVKWIESNYKIGRHGNPCGYKEDTIQLRRRKPCM